MQKYGKKYTGVHSGGGLELVTKLAREPASSRSKPRASPKNAPRILRVRRSLLDLAESDQTVVNRSAFHPETSLSRTSVRHSPGLLMIELPPAISESGASSRDRAGHGTLARAAALYQAFRDRFHLPLTCHLLPKDTRLEVGRGAPGGRHPQRTKPPPRANLPDESRSCHLVSSFEVESDPTLARKTLPQSNPKTSFRWDRPRTQANRYVTTKTQK